MPFPHYIACLRVVFATLLPLAAITPALAQDRIGPARITLLDEMKHLRSGTSREWNDFPEEPDQRSLSLEFPSDTNPGAMTLGLRVVDVKEGWEIRLNQNRLAQIDSDENDRELVWEIPPNTLLSGTNQLEILPTSDQSDDIRVGQIWLEPGAPAQVLGGVPVSLRTTDANGNSQPCRYTILDQRGVLVPFAVEPAPHLAVRSGVLYSSTGQAELELRPGTYQIISGRGFEYSRSTWTVSATENSRLDHHFSLEKVVDTSGWVACDPHVHTFEISRHGDASLQERMVTLAGEGISVAVATDHNVFVDYQPFLDEQQLTSVISPLIGNEVTTAFGHFNIFPARADTTPPDHRTDSWQELHRRIRTIPEIGFVILNHPRDVHSGFTPFASGNMVQATGRRLDGRELEADGMELINSAALQSDPMDLFDNWMTLVNRGHDLVAVGTSDSHEVSRKIVGQGRTYVKIGEDSGWPIDPASVAQQLRRGKARVSLGLLTSLTVQDRYQGGDLVPKQGSEPLAFNIRVQGPAWSSLKTVELYANGQLRKRWSVIPLPEAGRVIDQQFQWTEPWPTHDQQWVAVARGDGDLGLAWPIAKPYQPTSRNWEPYTWGSSGIVRVDADGDRRWSSARELARSLIEQSDGKLSELIRQLKSHDLPTALMAVEQWETEGKIWEPDALKEFPDADWDHVRIAVRQYQESLRESLRAKAQER